MKTLHVLLIVLVACLLGAGTFLVACGRGSDDGVKSDVLQQQSDLSDLAKKVDGNYDRLTDAEKKKFAVYGDEAAARKQVKLMAHPPNEQYLHKKS